MRHAHRTVALAHHPLQRRHARGISVSSLAAQQRSVTHRAQRRWRVASSVARGVSGKNI